MMVTDDCPNCGAKILSSERVDVCSNDDCDYGVYYPSAF